MERLITLRLMVEIDTNKRTITKEFREPAELCQWLAAWDEFDFGTWSDGVYMPPSPRPGDA